MQREPFLGARGAGHRRWIDAKPFGDLAHAGPLRLAQSLTDSRFKLRRDRRPPKPLALTTGWLKPGADSFPDHRPLELAEHAHHLEHGLAGRRPGVEPLLIQE